MEEVQKVLDTGPLEPEAIIEQLRALARQIPEFGQLPAATRKSLQAAGSVDAPFVQAAIAAVGTSPVVQQAVGLNADDMRAQADTADRWLAVEAEVRSLLKGVVSANLARRHRVGLAALQAYSISRQLVRKTPEHADLLPHVDEMKRRNRFGRRRARKPQPAPQPQSVL